MSKNIKSFKEMKDVLAYEFLAEQYIETLKSLGLIFRHKKTGAKVVILSNDDDNKVFCIGFRTPPKDSTGVAHIVEHTVLCGSDKFPAKDPFVELCKGSLNTFLNAMTYPDKTLYPIASYNDKDFKNLMNVYMDAVFHPNIYKNKKIFMQEGWHYELENKDDEIKYNGVVYNEMKGVFSSPEQQLYRLIQASLFPNTPYGVESGGDPEFITDLTYEDFIDFHSKYYHPTNSYIYLYGDIDIEERLEWIDENYLKDYDKISINSNIDKQKPFEKVREIQENYSISQDDTLENKTYLSYNTVISTSLDRQLYYAMMVIHYAVFNSPSAKVKKAIIDAKLGEDVLCSWDNGILQPVFSLIVKNSNIDKKDEFIKLYKETLKEIVNNGIDKKALQASINNLEFRYREADFGKYPKGLMYALTIFDSWLYDDEMPFIHIDANDTIKFLKEKINTNYYEEIIEKYFLNNTHCSIVILSPEKGLTEKLEENSKKKLKNFKKSLNDEQLEKIINDTKELKVFQDTPSTKEELEAIPLLKISDIRKDAMPLSNIENSINGVKIINHDYYTNGINYFNLCFNISDIDIELVPYLQLLSTVIGYMDSQNYTYGDLVNELNIWTGGIYTQVGTYPEYQKFDKYKLCFELIGKVLLDNTKKAFELVEELLYRTKFEDEKRFKEIILETKSRIQMSMMSSSDKIARGRVSAYYSENAYINDLLNGIGYYEFISNIANNFDNMKDEVLIKLKQIANCIFTKDNLIISYTNSKDYYDQFETDISSFIKNMPQENKDYTKLLRKDNAKKVCLSQLNEGFTTSGKVQYVVKAGNFIKEGLKSTGSLNVLKVILAYEYLWVNIRVKGGAYGCAGIFSNDGNICFSSYRDPNLSETLDVYNNMYEYIKNFNIDERDMTKYIIGAISNIDTPLSALAKGSRSFLAYMSNVNLAQLQKSRDELLNTNQENIRRLAEIVKCILDQNNVCVVGNENKIKENKKIFKNIRQLI